jgi:hypothetical protein
MPTYYSNAGPAPGPVFYRALPDSIGVLQAPDDHMPVGMALAGGWTEDGLAMWRLTLHGVTVPGRWIFVDREFVPAP